MELVKTITRIPGIISVVLNRPEQHNSLNDGLVEELTVILSQLIHQPEIKAVVIESTGKSFCSGADLNSMQKSALHSFQENLSDALALSRLMHLLNDFPKPTFALVQGPTLGGGVGLVSCCDIVIAKSSAWFAFSEVKIGLIPAVISPFVIAAIGERQARRYFLTAEKFSASKAQAINLVHEVVEGDLWEAALPTLEQLLKNAPQALSEAKRLIQLVSHHPLDDALRHKTASLIAERRASKEGIEGIRAFLEKREPTW